jgi:hypothetical protein
VKRPQLLQTRVERRNWDFIMEGRPAKVVRHSDATRDAGSLLVHRLEPPTARPPPCWTGPAVPCSEPPWSCSGGVRTPGGMRPLVANVAPQGMRTHGSKMGCR